MQNAKEENTIKATEHSLIFTALGTVNNIRIFACRDKAAADKALRLAQARVTTLHDRLSVFKPDSEIALLNASAGGAGVKVSDDTMFLLSESKRYSRLSNGAFSITTRPLSALWQIHARCGSVPGRAEIEHALALVSDEDILLDGDSHTARLRLFGQSVDLGGIAKGYAADEVRNILLENGVTRALVNLGGTVVSIGGIWQIGIQHPDRITGIAMGRVSLENRCAVTSGDYERYYEVDGVRYHHILDPRTGYPSRSHLRSITLIGENALSLDALTTAIFVLGEEEGLRLARDAEAEAVFVTQELDVLCTEGLRGSFELLQA